MRWPEIVIALTAATALIVGCGGKVVIDPESQGQGGGASGSTSSTAGGAGGGSFTCELACGGPIGLCACTGPCSDGKTRAVGCGKMDAGPTVCDCIVDTQMVGTCEEPELTCGLPGSCCAAVFGL
ncbi:MAG: hypothetical protein U0359_10695 [Byssovorax sp.]